MAHVSDRPLVRDRKRVRRSHHDYTIACFCALPVEIAALQAMLDEVHDDLPTSRQNAYTLGELNHHNIVIVALPCTGNSHSGAAAVHLLTDFPSIQFGLLVGIAGGIPVRGKSDIRLGDVVVGEPSGVSGGVLQFDRGKVHSGDEFELTGHSNKPSAFLSATVRKLRAQHQQQGNRIPSLVRDMLHRHRLTMQDFQYPGADEDQLFEADYEHETGDTCQNCKPSRIVERTARTGIQPVIHYGTIGSSNSVIKNADERDRLARKYNILCVEMEAGGLVDQLSCLVVRGICDYADSHKNKRWQPYAAATAAAYIKEILGAIPMENSTKSSDLTTPFPHHVDQAIKAEPIPRNLPTLVDDRSRLRALMDSLTFDRMDARLRNIPQALSETCNRLMTHQEFQNWKDEKKLQEHHGFLWVKGKPGSGKSTIMKALLAWEKEKRKDKLRKTIISYFFNARAPTDLEKSSLGLYRSLTHQLLKECPELYSTFLQHFSYKEDSAETGEWTASELRTFLITVIPTLLNHSVVIMIDALDEGDETDVRQLVAFLEDLGAATYAVKSSTRICLSSRHYPHITIKKGVSLKVEGQSGHHEDIQKYVRAKLVDDASGGMDDIRDEICRKSKSVFLWIVLVVPILNEAYDHGQRITAHSISDCLKDIPGELDELFTKILARNTNGMADSFSLLQWVLFSRKSLTPVELYTAIGITSSSAFFNDPHNDADTISRCILNTSRGLTEISKSEPHIVQFIHETVRDFLMKTGLRQIDSSLCESVEGDSHDKLKSCCWKYTKQCFNIVPESKDMSKREREAAETEILRQFPLGEYVARYLFEHADFAQGKGISQQEFLQQIQTVVPDRDSEDYDKCTDFQKWVRLRNVFTQYKIGRYHRDVSAIYVFAAQHHNNLLQLIGQAVTAEPLQMDRYGSSLQAACAVGNERGAKILIEFGANVNYEGGECGNALFAAILSKTDSLIHLLLRNGATAVRQDAEKRLFVCIARAYPLGVQILLRLGASVKCVNRNRRTPLIVACSQPRECLQIVSLLIENGSQVVYTSRNDLMSPLSLASARGHEATVRLLIEKGANLELAHQTYDSPLYAASKAGHDTVVSILIEHGTDVDARGGVYGTALQVACIHGHESVIRVLLKHGADPNKLASPKYALQAACYTVSGETLQLLLEHGADVNVLNMIQYQHMLSMTSGKAKNNA